MSSRAAPAEHTRADYVLDASAVIKTMADEAWAAELRAWLVERHSEGCRFHAPHVLRYEAGHFLSRVSREPPAARGRRLQAALVSIAFADSEAENHAPPLTYYDASYVALARAMRCALVTYDAKQSAVADQAGVAIVAPGMLAGGP